MHRSTRETHLPVGDWQRFLLLTQEHSSSQESSSDQPLQTEVIMN